MKPLRGVLGVVGELCVTAGALVLLFVVWQLGFVALVDGHQQQGTVSALEQEFRGGAARPGAPAQGSSPPLRPSDLAQAARDDRAWAILHVPRLGGPDWRKPIYEGVEPRVLAEGLGHYTTTALPGEIGNTAIAGHRAGHGNPLIDIDRIQTGDVMVIETREAFFVYRVVGHEIVDPTDVAVLAPVPQQPGAQPTTASFTLTSCDPRYGSTHRYIVFSTLTQTIPHAKGLPPTLLADPSTAA